MPKKDLTLTSQVILALHMAEDLTLPFVSIKDMRHRLMFPESHNRFRAIFYRLKKRGLLKFIKYKENRFIKLTKKGEIEALLSKARVENSGPWDGKWRLFMYDIPVEAGRYRDNLRRLLKKNHFIQLQGSVFISPYSLKREAISYLQEKGLMDYIRIMRVDEVDNDKDLRKKFGFS